MILDSDKYASDRPFSYHQITEHELIIETTKTYRLKGLQYQVRTSNLHKQKRYQIQVMYDYSISKKVALKEFQSNGLGSLYKKYKKAAF